MTSDPDSHENQVHTVAFKPLKPKRRCKIEEPFTPEPEKPKEKSHSPVLLNARAEFRRQHPRINRSGRPQIQFHRVTPPSELSELMPNKPKSPMLARVVDKVKSMQGHSRHRQGIWSVLRYWALAFR